MTTNQTNNRLSVVPYHEILEGVVDQFALIRFGLGKLSKRQIQEFFKTRIKDQAAELKASLQLFAENLPKEIPEEQREKAKIGGELAAEHWKKREGKKHRPADTRFKFEFSEDRLNQSELLLLVAHFEAFMKELHRTFLSAFAAQGLMHGPLKLVLGEADIPDSVGPFSRYLKGFIQKEVKRVDAQGIKDRAAYFADYFGCTFGSEDEIGQLKAVMDKRNLVTHEIYTAPRSMLDQAAEQPIVGDDTLQNARWLFWEVPRKCVQVGAKNYPAYFR
jgi:hypothetical protein